MTYPNDPSTLYDQVVEDREYVEVNGTRVPIRTSVVDEIAEHAGAHEIRLSRPDGETHVLEGSDPIPARDDLLEELLAAQRAFDDLPVSALTNLFGGRLGPLHYTDTTAHFTVSESIFDARGQRGTGPMPEEFESLGVRAAHLSEGFKVANALPHHWVDDVGWGITQREHLQAAEDDEAVPEDRAPPIAECLVINVPIAFPAGSFSRATGVPSTLVNSAISRTERTLDDTLLTQRMAQLDAIETVHGTLEMEIDRGLITVDELQGVDTVVRETFHISDSGLASLRSQLETRKQEAFETVRRLADSENFSYVMAEHAETIDELGELAMLGTKYRTEVLDKPPGFY